MVHTKRKNSETATETHPRNQGRVPNFLKSQNILFLGPGLGSSLLKYWKGQIPLCGNSALISPLMVFIAYKEQLIHEDTTHGQCPVNKRTHGGQPVSTRRLVFAVSNPLLICVAAAISGVSTFVTGDIIFVQVIGTIIHLRNMLYFSVFWLFWTFRFRQMSNGRFVSGVFRPALMVSATSKVKKGVSHSLTVHSWWCNC